MTIPRFDLSRRAMIVSGLAAGTLPACSQRNLIAPDFAAIENEAGGPLGIAAMDLSSKRVLSHRGGERFAMCSTFKWLLGALILQKVEQGSESLTREVPINADDLVFYSPVTATVAGKGSMSVGALCAATIATSDNTAANLLLASLGGPTGFTDLVRASGDQVTRLDRLEPELNENAPGDPQDTTTPTAMLETMNCFLFGKALSRNSQEILRRWMIDASTGLSRLRAGLPTGWLAGDKTGTSSNDQSNDVGFAIAPLDQRGAGPVLIVSYASVANPMSSEVNAIHAEIAREVCRVFEI